MGLWTRLRARRDRQERDRPARTELSDRQRQRRRAFLIRTTPKGGNVPRAEVRRRRERNRRARVARKRNRPPKPRRSRT